ncbi:hypothetical protein KL942_005350 [Ogataea angusta]|uniref:Restriction of telomere capping protein 1 n=1 Tax=Pichia angusta TaxID=870730 RepID=A0ABQ7RPI5_PICAN|nr:hypothetical protein KL942_005350 [Ogataea angusta]KAG7845055.1 hypothetical protein KL940_005289 [Ogataea angusta]
MSHESEKSLDRPAERAPDRPLSSSPSAMFVMDHHRRSSGQFSRMAFNIYGLSTNTSPNPSSSSVSHAVPASSLSILPSSASVSKHHAESNKTRLHTVNEILTCAKSNETPNLFVVGGPKALQLVKVAASEISVEYDLVAPNAGSRSNKYGLVADAKFGYQQYGRNIAISTLSGSIHVYNLDRGTRVRSTFSDHQRAVNSIDFNPLSPHTLLSGSQDGKMKIWDLRTKNTKAQLTIRGNSDAVRCVQFSPRTARNFCSIADSGVIQKWDLRKPSAFERKLNAHTGPGLTLDWHPELDYLISGGRDKQLQVWNMGPGSDHQREPDHVINTAGAVSKASWCRGRGNGSVLTTDVATCFLNDDPCIQIWSLARKHVPKNVIELHTNQVTGLVWKTPRYLVSASKDKTLVQHDVSTEPRLVDTLPTMAAAWDSQAGARLTFVSQDRNQFEETEELVPSEPYHPTSPNLVAKARPALPRQPSQFQRAVRSPYALQADIPIPDNDTDVFRFLSSNYLVQVPDGMDLLQVCDYNASVAAAAGRYRDCQVWKTIEGSILWEENDKVVQGLQEFHLEERDGAVRTESRSSLNNSDHLSTSVDSYDGGLNRDGRFGLTANANENENAIVDDDDECSGHATRAIEIKRASDSLARHTFSFTGTSVDLDNEKLQLSGSPHSKYRSKKLSMTQMASLSSSPAKSLRLLPKEVPVSKEPATPWNPVDLVRQAAVYSSTQGDATMCATLALLFGKRYPQALSELECQDWILTYHDLLQRRCLFAVSANVLKTAAMQYELFTKIGQSQTSFRLFCQHCNTPILNEHSKNMWLQDPEIEFGFWYCDRCGKTQGGCIYCNEPAKGACVVLERCGHKGHFGCLRTWFVDNMEDCCPGCGTECVR